MSLLLSDQCGLVSYPKSSSNAAAKIAPFIASPTKWGAKRILDRNL